MRRALFAFGIVCTSNLALADELYCRLKAPVGEVKCFLSSNTRWEGGWDGEESYQVEYFRVVVKDSSSDGRYCLTSTYYDEMKARSELEFLKNKGICPIK